MLLFVVALLVLIPLCAFLAASIAAGLFSGPRPTSAYAAGLYFSVVAPVVAVAVTLVFRRSIDRRTIASLGISFDRRWWSLLLTGCGLAGLAAIPGIVRDQHQGIKLLGSTLAANPGAIGVATNASWVALAIIVGSTIFENVAIRGYLLQNVWEQWGRLPAVLATALAQVWISGPGFPVSIDVAALSVYLTLTVFWSGSLWFAMGFMPVWLVVSAANPDTTDVIIQSGGVILTGILTFFAHKRGLFVGRGTEDYQRPSQAPPVALKPKTGRARG